MINAAAPKDAPRRINLMIKKTVICPAVPRRGPEAGSPHKISLVFADFHGLGVNARLCTFLQSNFFKSESISGKIFSIDPSPPARNFSIAIRLIGKELHAGACEK
jgi:hypothetical protein